MKFPPDLSDEAELEAYKYFDKHIRPFPKKDDGSLDLGNATLQHNDVDAFRHAYVSGVFTHEYGEKGAKLAEWLNEKFVRGSRPGDENMDFWNNAVGIRLAIVLREGDSGANEFFFDHKQSLTLSREEFVQAIAKGQYPEYEVRTINGKKYPASSRDNTSNNNLG